MVKVEALSRVYGDVAVLDRLTFEVERGEVVGFLGANGAGKTTTMRILTGYLPPSAGRATIDGFDTFGDSLRVRERVGYLPEGAPLYPDMRVREYLSFRARLKGIGWRRRGREVAAVAARAFVDDVIERPIGVLSRGYRQRVGLADALLGSPPLLILDEPTAGLDPNQVLRVRDLVREMAGQQTVLLSTHLLVEVEATCTRAIIIHEGRIVYNGTIGQLTSDGRSLDEHFTELTAGRSPTAA